MIPIIKAKTDGSIYLGDEKLGTDITIRVIAQSFYALDNSHIMRYGIELEQMLATKMTPSGGGKMYLSYIKEVNKFGIVLISIKYNLLGNVVVPQVGNWYTTSVSTIEHKQYKWTQLRFADSAIDLGIDIPTEIIEAWNVMAIERA